MSDIKAVITEILRDKLKATYVEADDQSRFHAGHKAAGGGGHFVVIVVSPLFSGKTLIERHRLVYDSILNCLGEKVHALAIKAYTQEEWASNSF